MSHVSLLSSWLSQPGKRGPVRKKSSLTLQVESLEQRDVPAAISFTNGTLLIDASRDTRALNLKLHIDFQKNVTGSDYKAIAGAKPVQASAVEKIVVIGSDFDDRIDLTNVGRSAFRNLDDKVSVSGRGGNDTIFGSAFSDIISGGEHNDIIHGGEGNDKILGDGGNDRLYGDSGDDTIRGGSGDDLLWGGSGAVLPPWLTKGRDILDGGSGFDTAQDYDFNDVLVSIEKKIKR